MSLITANFFLDVLSIIIALTAVLYGAIYWYYQYWQRLNVPTIEPINIPWGNTKGLFAPASLFDDFYKEFKKRGVRYGGIYAALRPIFIPIDLNIVKNILIKDFDSFVDRGLNADEKLDPLSGHLFALDGTKWRNLRNKLSPTFTSGKMKMMFETLVSCTPSMVERIGKHLDEPLDIKEILCCFTTDVIGSCAFGLDCKSFSEEVVSPFRAQGRKIFTPSKWRVAKISLRRVAPSLGHLLRLKVTKQETEDFFLDLLRKTENYREESHVQRNDFVQLLLNLKDQLTFNERAAQAFVFFVAGFETSATTMTFALYNLSKNPEIQEKTRAEVCSVLEKHQNKMTYEAISEMKYLTQVVDETLRMYPPVPLLNRKSVKDYKLPDEDLVIPKGTDVVIPVRGIHYDKDYYPEPEKFDPEHFSDANRQNHPSCSYLPFGDGPRNCIGLRFGLMQSKVGLATLLTNYRFTVNPKTQEPIQLDPKQFVTTIEGGCWLNAERI